MHARLLDIRFTRFALPLAACSIALLPLVARAQSDSPAVVPGIKVNASHGSIGVADTVVYQRSITKAGKDTTAGTRTVVSKVLDQPDHTLLLEVEQRFPAGGGEIVDTAVAELGSLRAVAHRSHQPTRTMRFDFYASAAHGTVTPVPTGSDSAAAPKDVHQDIGGPIFDSNVIDLVVASLPLERGFSAELPFFIYERGGRVPMAVSVRDRSTLAFGKLGQRDAWIVNVAVPDAPATVWVDAKTHAVLRVRYDIASRGMSFTDERITPLHG